MDIRELSDNAIACLKKDDVTKKELKEFCEAQYKEIVRLLHDNKKLENEVAHLKTLVTSAVPLIETGSVTNEELICLKQIEDLKRASEVGSLTYEETKKFVEYVKVLKMIRGKDDGLKDLFKDVKTDDLNKIVDEQIK